ncbi:MAG: hypothetical protein IT517_06705 [Burkholderiales bacterium]|nr:hypothetical protein [Burkholderiales bacterium]
MSQRERNVRYQKELTGALVLYAIVLVAALTFGQRMAPGVAQTALYVSPMLPFLLAVWAIVRQIRRSDEFVRKTTLEHVAIAAAVTAGWTFTYGFLENAGYPRLSMFTVWPVMGAVWGVLAIASSLRQR